MPKLHHEAHTLRVRPLLSTPQPPNHRHTSHCHRIGLALPSPSLVASSIPSPPRTAMVFTVKVFPPPAEPTSTPAGDAAPVFHFTVGIAPDDTFGQVRDKAFAAMEELDDDGYLDEHPLDSFGAFRTASGAVIRPSQRVGDIYPGVTATDEITLLLSARLHAAHGQKRKAELPTPQTATQPRGKLRAVTPAAANLFRPQRSSLLSSSPALRPSSQPEASARETPASQQLFTVMQGATQQDVKTPKKKQAQLWTLAEDRAFLPWVLEDMSIPRALRKAGLADTRTESAGRNRRRWYQNCKVTMDNLVECRAKSAAGNNPISKRRPKRETSDTAGSTGVAASIARATAPPVNAQPSSQNTDDAILDGLDSDDPIEDGDQNGGTLRREATHVQVSPPPGEAQQANVGAAHAEDLADLERVAESQYEDDDDNAPLVNGVQQDPVVTSDPESSDDDSMDDDSDVIEYMDLQEENNASIPPAASPKQPTAGARNDNLPGSDDPVVQQILNADTHPRGTRERIVPAPNQWRELPEHVRVIIEREIEAIPKDQGERVVYAPKIPDKEHTDKALRAHANLICVYKEEVEWYFQKSKYDRDWMVSDIHTPLLHQLAYSKAFGLTSNEDSRWTWMLTTSQLNIGTDIVMSARDKWWVFHCECQHKFKKGGPTIWTKEGWQEADFDDREPHYRSLKEAQAIPRPMRREWIAKEVHTAERKRQRRRQNREAGRQRRERQRGAAAGAA
jgi:hypothetical protein